MIWYRNAALPPPAGDIRWVDDLATFNRHLLLCDCHPISPETWQTICAAGTRYACLFEGGEPVARSGVEKLSDALWETSDVRVAKPYRNRGYGKAISAHITAHILASGRTASCRTEPDNLPMRKIIESLGFRPVGEVLGLASGEVRLMPHNPIYSLCFEEELDAIRRAMGPALESVDHAGSTAVPGLPAKPILDICAAASDLPTLPTAPLEALGYEYRGEYGIPGRRYFIKRARGLTTHHLHIYAPDHPDRRNMLAFRDILAAHPDASAHYAALKRSLMEKFPADRESYTDAKAQFIRDTLASYQ